MVPHYSKIHNRFKLNGRYFNREGLLEVAQTFIKEGLSYEKAIGNFLLDWLSDVSFIKVKTSGSTGTPKRIKLSKQAMVHSAIATGNYFNLNPGDRALLCLPSEFIAGKMMLVRALILGLQLDLVKPSSSPFFKKRKHYDFVAMTPMQLSNVKSAINTIKTVIVGGGKVSSALKEQVKDTKSQLYETYGMTETITHIAVKRFSESYFKLLPNISISTDQRACLVIDAPRISSEKIITNDVVKLYSDTEFELLGRYDSIINSGGLKIHPEQIEEQLSSRIDTPFFLASLPDNVLGERLILVLESNSNIIDSIVFKGLDKYHVPKEIFNVSQFEYTKSGKIDRLETVNQILNKT